MKNKLICLIITIALSTSMFIGCGQNNTGSSQVQATIDTNTSGEVQEDSPQDESLSVAEATESSEDSLDNELHQVELKAEAIYDKLSDDCTQPEMNLISYEVYMLWDDELNSLWSRFSANADADLKAKVLDEQRHWIKDKELQIEASGLSCYMGSMQPTIENERGAELTKARCFELAQYVSEVTGLSFTLDIPKISKSALIFVDTQGTTDIYSNLLMDVDCIDGATTYFVSISLHRLAQLNGYAEKISDTEYIFETYESDLEGIITLSTDTASFEVTKSANELLNIGDVFVFPEAY